MDYLIFTYPNCQKCEDVKAVLDQASIRAEIYNLVDKQSRLRIKEFLGHVKRDEKGSIILPTLICRNNGQVAAVINTRQELEAWLKSRV
jgi:arsenate reductase-like glutaredoxin family protein